MTTILPFLKDLISVAGLSAHEGPVMELIKKQWAPLVDEIVVSRLGSLHALKRGRGRGRHPVVMLAAHMDSIGLIVTGVVDGLLSVGDIGGVDPRVLPGMPVRVHGRRPLPGAVVAPPRQSLRDERRDAASVLSQLWVDVGLEPRRVESLVRVGDLVSFDTPAVELAGGTLSGHALDNRASVAAVTCCLEQIQGKAHVWDVSAVATTQEEETMAGAATSAFALEPDLAIVVDVTHAKGPGAEDWRTFGLGKGPTLGWAPNLHPYLFKRFEELAKELEVPALREVMPQYSGTDADEIQLAGEGIPTMLVSIPIRYMHTPVEVVSIKDIQRAGRLLASFVTRLDKDFFSQMTWTRQDARD